MRSGGSFEVNKKDFKDDPGLTAGVEAYKFIEQIKNETGHRDTVIEKVIYDGQNDITEITRQIRPVIDDSILPF